MKTKKVSKEGDTQFFKISIFYLIGRTYTTKVSNTMYHQVVFQVSICDKMRWKTYTIQKLLTLQQYIFKFNYYVFNEQFLRKPCDVRARNLTPCLYLMNLQMKLSNNAQIKMNTYFNSSKISTKCVGFDPGS